MTRKSMVGICLLCAFVIGAVAAQSAIAIPTGTTVFTCKKKAVKGGVGFSKAHCKKEDAVSSEAEYEHVAVAENTTTTVTGTTLNTKGEETPSFLESVQSGVAEQLESKLAHILPELNGQKSWVRNMKDPETGEHTVEGEVWVRYTKVAVTKPAGKGCKVKGEEVTTNRLKFSTKGQEVEVEGKPEMFVKFEPAVEGQPFAVFEVEGCSVVALNGKYEAIGSVKARADGTTLSLTHSDVTTQGTLKLRGQKAGFESVTTIEATDPELKDTVDTPLSVTTVSTP